MEEAEYCDRVVVLVAGRVVVSDTLERIVAGRTALEVRAARWDVAFRTLDEAGMVPSLRGRSLRLVGADERRVSAVLAEAGVDAALGHVPASFEEAFVDLVTGEAAR